MSNTIATAVSKTLNVELAKGSAVFNNADNSITLPDIGRTPEVGDVISVKGSVNNSKEFTIEEILSNDKIIVNKAHAGKAWTEENKSLFSETIDVEVRLLCKWYLAPIGLGQGWVDVLDVRMNNTPYQNLTGRPMDIYVATTVSDATATNFTISEVFMGNIVANNAGGSLSGSVTFTIPKNATYQSGNISPDDWKELR